MEIIFLTMSRITRIAQRGIYTDLMRKFHNEGHTVYIVTPNERSFGRPTELLEQDGVYVLGVKTLNLQKTSVIEKGIGQVLVERQYKRAIKSHLKGIKFDMILYSTPPITFPNVIKYLKRCNPSAKTYLLLKDIFPQNAVDMGLMNKNGIKGILYNYFRKKEKILYAISDFIGCMSPANVDYILKHNKGVYEERIEVAPNSLELRNDDSCDEVGRIAVRMKYGIPDDRLVFVYGGNLGKPQGIDYLIRCLELNKKRKDCCFVIVGNGTEYDKLDRWCKANGDCCVKLMQRLPKDAYDLLVRSCDVGLIFLDHHFTIPNYPSRLLSYLENKMPVICATDVNTDIGRIAEENGYGFWCESVRPEDFTSLVDKMLAANRREMGEKGFEFLKKNYLVENTYNAIMSHV